MAFTDAAARLRAADNVRNVLGKIRTVHAMAIELRDVKALYLAGTNPTFNTVFDAIFDTAADRAELGVMIDQLTALCVTDWEANHSAVLGLP